MAVVSVTGGASLKTALANAKSGDVIKLRAGDYGDVALKNLNFSSQVTIVSADSNNEAVFKSLTLNNVHNVVFKSIDVEHIRGAKEGHSITGVEVSKSSKIVFDDFYLHGSLDNNPSNDGYGMRVSGSSQVSILNSEFEQFFRGLVVAQSTDITVAHNDFHDIRTVASVFAEVQRVKIDHNRITDLYPIGDDHPDAIQFLTNGTKTASRDIVITNNVIMQGDGNGMQGIFLRDETNKLPYKNVTIQNNLVYLEDYYNGISVLGGDTVKIIGNTVLSPANDSVKVRIWAGNVINGTISDNVADTFIETGKNRLQLSHNMLLTDTPGKASQIRDLNAGSLADLADLLVNGYGYKPTGLAAGSPGEDYGGAAAPAPVTPPPPAAPVPAPAPAPGPIEVKPGPVAAHLGWFEDGLAERLGGRISNGGPLEDLSHYAIP